MSTIHVSVRLDEATMARVDALGPQFSTEWRTATRSDILRALILLALEGYERGAASPPSRLSAAKKTAPRKRKRTKEGARTRKGKK